MSWLSRNSWNFLPAQLVKYFFSASSSSHTEYLLKDARHCLVATRDCRMRCGSTAPKERHAEKQGILEYLHHACTALWIKGARVEGDIILQPRDNDSAKEHLMARAY